MSSSNHLESPRSRRQVGRHPLPTLKTDRVTDEGMTTSLVPHRVSPTTYSLTCKEGGMKSGLGSGLLVWIPPTSASLRRISTSLRRWTWGQRTTEVGPGREGICEPLSGPGSRVVHPSDGLPKIPHPQEDKQTKTRGHR